MEFYVQITTRCNMRCLHCAYSCYDVGQNISINHFRKVIEIIKNNNGKICLGGGEPTIHPLFWHFVNYSIKNGVIPAIVTNGKKTGDAMKLLALSINKTLLAKLSLDKYHEKVDFCIEDGFRKADLIHNTVAIHGPINIGRAKKLNCKKRNICSCDNIFIEPNGDIWNCGCKRNKLGTVESPNLENYFPCDYF